MMIMVLVTVLFACSAASAEGQQAWDQTSKNLREARSLQFVATVWDTVPARSNRAHEYVLRVAHDQRRRRTVVEGLQGDEHKRLSLPKGSVWSLHGDGKAEQLSEDAIRHARAFAEHFADGFARCKTRLTSPKGPNPNRSVTVSCPDFAFGTEFEVRHGVRIDKKHVVTSIHIEVGGHMVDVTVGGTLFDRELPKGFSGEKYTNFELPDVDALTLERTVRR